MKVIIGLGKTGLSCAKYFSKRQIDFSIFDTRVLPPGLAEFKRHYPSIAVQTGPLSLDCLLKADEIIVSPGVSLKTPEITAAMAKGVPCIGDVELFAREAKAPIIAITGSNGKTTVTTLIGKMLVDAGFKAKVCGNIGVSVLDLLEEEIPDFYVVELSSFQLETTHHLNAKIGMVLNITPDHMDRYANLFEYYEAKQRIYAQCEQAILNIDAPEAWSNADFPLKQLAFSAQTSEAVDVYLKLHEDKLFIFYRDQPCFPVAQLPSQSGFHLQNTLAALTLGFALDLPVASMLKTMQTFKGLPHRCQKIASFAGVDWYNDSKGTNVGATLAALDSIGPLYSDIILIAGGDAKSADLKQLSEVSQYVSHAILLGRDAAQIESVLSGSVLCYHVNDMREAVKKAAALSAPQCAVLLSPACASWDMYEGYEQRGQIFCQSVEELMYASGK